MIINVDKYGACDNFAIALDQAVKDADNGDTLVFSNKEYHFYKDFCQSRTVHMTNTDSFENPKKYFAFLLENLDNITIDGNGATLVIHGDISAFCAINCNNLTIKNLKIKYNSPANVELTVKSKKANSVLYTLPESTLWYANKKDVTFFEQSPFTKKNYWQFTNYENCCVTVCHTSDDVFRVPLNKSVFSFVKSVERVSKNELKVNYYFPRKFNVGDTYALSQNMNRHTCGIFLSQCDNVVCENMEVNYMAGFGWLSQMCGNLTFNKIVFKPDEQHKVSSFADLIHICGCKGKVKINDCSFSHPHDDAINIHGAFLRFKEKIADNKAIFEFVHKQQGGYSAFNCGDLVQLYYRTNLQKIANPLKVVAAVDDIENKTVLLEFSENLPDDITSKAYGQSNVVVENISYCPSVEISNCKFNAIPTRAILCSTSNQVKIHNNIFDNVTMASVFISNDANDWYESGPVSDFEIYDNVFNLNKSDKCRCANSPAVLIEPVTLGGKINKPVHKNISIYNNVINSFVDSPIIANGVKNLIIENNIINGCEKIIKKYCN